MRFLIDCNAPPNAGDHRFSDWKPELEVLQPGIFEFPDPVVRVGNCWGSPMEAARLEARPKAKVVPKPKNIRCPVCGEAFDNLYGNWGCGSCHYTMPQSVACGSQELQVRDRPGPTRAPSQSSTDTHQPPWRREHQDWQDRGGIITKGKGKVKGKGTPGIQLQIQASQFVVCRIANRPKLGTQSALAGARPGPGRGPAGARPALSQRGKKWVPQIRPKPGSARAPAAQPKIANCLENPW